MPGTDLRAWLFRSKRRAASRTGTLAPARYQPTRMPGTDEAFCAGLRLDLCRALHADAAQVCAPVYGGSAAAHGGSAAVYGGRAAVYGGRAAVYGGSTSISGGSAAVYGGGAHGIMAGWVGGDSEHPCRERRCDGWAASAGRYHVPYRPTPCLVLRKCTEV
eukprot:2975501-Rhodomonas_salina.3